MCFALSASPVFSRTDTATDSEKFYTSILELLEDPQESREVNELFVWWNRWLPLLLGGITAADFLWGRQIFPAYSSAQRTITKDSALAKIQARRRALMQSVQQNSIAL